MREVVPLSPRLDGEVESYVAAARAESRQMFATAAVIGTLGLTLAIPPANGEIIYTPANQTLVGSRFNATMQIDFNNDGIADVVLAAYTFRSFSSGFRIESGLGVSGLNSNQVLRTYDKLALADVQGQIIGSTVAARSGFGGDANMATFREASNGFGSFHKTSRGFWLHATNRYLGVRFAIDGQMHYGWARLNAGAGWAQLTGYAYETIPDKPIRAGILPTPESNAAPQRPATLGVLAMGASRLSTLFVPYTSH